MPEERYRTLNSYYKELFGSKVYKLALDGGMTCPNRDGTISKGGCIFCSAGGSGDFAEKPCGDVKLQIKKAKERIASKTKAEKFIAYFQSYTNTYASVEYLSKLFYDAIEDDSVVGLSIGTRPDCLPPDILELLSDLNQIKPVFVELGLQTIHAETANLIRRGYPLSVFDTAMQNLKAIGIHTVVHVILGLPNESKNRMLDTVRYVGNSGAEGIKLQLLHVLKGTELEKMWRRGEFQTLSMDEYIDILGECIEVLPPQMVIHRLTGDAPKKLLCSPLWSADKKRVLNTIQATFNARDIRQGRCFSLSAST